MEDNQVQLFVGYTPKAPFYLASLSHPPTAPRSARDARERPHRGVKLRLEEPRGTGGPVVFDTPQIHPLPIFETVGQEAGQEP